MHRAWAIVERELRRFRRSPFLIVFSLLFPLVQLVILGYAFGGNVKHLVVAVVDHDHGVPAVKVRELASAVAANATLLMAIAFLVKSGTSRSRCALPWRTLPLSWAATRIW